MPSLSNNSGADYDATEKTNTADVLTPILELTPKDGLAFALINAAVRTGDAIGVPMYWDPKQGAASDLPVDTELALQFKSPSMDDRQTVSVVRDNIQPWRARSVADQQNEEYIDSVKIQLKGRAVRVRDIDTFYVSVDSSATMSWSDSEGLYFDPEAVRTMDVNTPLQV